MSRRTISPTTYGRRFPPFVVIAVWLLVATGCTSWKLGSHWSPHGSPPLIPQADPTGFHPLADLRARRELWVDNFQLGRDAYERAEGLARRELPHCVDAFYRAALHSAAAHAEAEPSSFDGRDGQRSRALRLYHASVKRLIYEGQRHQRLNPTGGLLVRDADGEQVVPLEMHGFAWRAEDFQEWHVVGDYHHEALTNEKASPGIGVPLVVLRRKPPESAGPAVAGAEPDFLPPLVPFAATAVLRSDGSAIELYDPGKFASVEFCGTNCRLARDLSAPLAYQLHFHDEGGIQGFLQPGQPKKGDGSLLFLEPFQPDKIPLIFIHGLLSEPRAWADVGNELRACPDLADEYQLWFFKYATGEPFLSSAAKFRAQLDAVQQRFDPAGTNRRLRQIVAVGHSMGGLVAKLQVVHSGDDLWNLVSRVPLEAIVTDETTRGKLVTHFFFDPHPLVRRVVFVATPHHGSATAGRVIGRVASAMVSQSNEAHDKLRRDNPHALKPFVERQLPTSIDLLEPDNPLLDTMRRLRVGDAVVLHSIIGNGVPTLTPGGSDGVVTVQSARHANVCSERLVPATHTHILRDPETIAELKRILRQHAATVIEAE